MNYSVYLIDAVPLVILLAAVLICKHKGFAAIVMSVIAVCVCMGFASQYASVFAQAAVTNIIHPKFVNYISEKLISGLANGQTALGSILPQALVSYSGMGADDTVKTEIINSISEKIAAGAEKSAIIPFLTSFMFVLTYVVAKLISRIFIKVSDLLLKLPVIEKLNGGLGAALGVILGAVLALLSIMVIVSVSRFTPQSQFGLLVAQTKIVNPLYEKIIASI